MKQTACPENCPGCGYKNRTYAEVFEQKVNFAKQKLSKWNDFVEIFHDQPNDILNYRRKVTLHARFFETWHIGLLKNDNIINIPHCPIQAHIINESIAKALHFFPDYKYFPLIYWVQSNRQIVWVLKTNQLPDMAWLNPDLTNALSKIGIEGISIHLNPSAGKKVFLKDRLVPVFGKSFSTDDEQMQYGPLSFQQQIEGFTAKPIEIASQYFKKQNINAVIDLYCGLGKSLKMWNHYQWINLGVELSNEACKFAEINNPNSLILKDKCHQRIPQINSFINENSEKNWGVYVNPPRMGIDDETMQWLSHDFKPNTINYLSCNPTSLARDLMLLEKSGYKIIKLILFDFFPYTRHIETLAVLKI